VLCENSAGSGFLAEHGLSYLIEKDGKKLLFDTGATDVYLKNAFRLGYNLDKDLSTVVLSHGHWDHANGLKFLTGKNVICHPKAFMQRYRKVDGSVVGVGFNETQVLPVFNLQYSEHPLEIQKGLFFLGAIPRSNDFESLTTPFMDANGMDDFVPDDSALAVVKDKKLIVISGCAHAGICNTIAYAQKVTGIEIVQAVLGGFHLKGNDVQTEKTIEFLKSLKVPSVTPSHCTELPALASFYAAFGGVQLKTGQVLQF
jgi:7,8-dihydropterin-6-yl-methyl-4-(beta-D-ribofuranosyl)aminobenzene 5'-phosphate synthase